MSHESKLQIEYNRRQRLAIMQAHKSEINDQCQRIIKQIQQQALDLENPQKMEQFQNDLKMAMEGQELDSLQQIRALREQAAFLFGDLRIERQNRQQQEAANRLMQKDNLENEIQLLIEKYSQLPAPQRGVAADRLQKMIDQIRLEKWDVTHIQQQWTILVEQLENQLQEQSQEREQENLKQIIAHDLLPLQGECNLEQALHDLEKQENTAIDEELRRDFVGHVYHALLQTGFSMEEPFIVDQIVELRGRKGIHEQVWFKFHLDGHIHDAFENYEMGNCHQDRNAFYETLKQIYPSKIILKEILHHEELQLWQKNAFDQPQYRQRNES